MDLDSSFSQISSRAANSHSPHFSLAASSSHQLMSFLEMALPVAPVGCRSLLQHGAASGHGALLEPFFDVDAFRFSALMSHQSRPFSATNMKSETLKLKAAVFNAVRVGEASGRDTIGDLAQWLEARRAVKLSLSVPTYGWKAAGAST